MAARARKLDVDIGSDDDERLALESAARIASDMVLAGNGRDVLALWASVAVKGEVKGEGNEGGTLAEALKRLPGVKSTFDPIEGAARSLPESGKAETTDTSVDCDNGTTDYASVGTGSVDPAKPFFHPQSILPGMVPPPRTRSVWQRPSYTAASMRDEVGDLDSDLKSALAPRAGDGACDQEGGPPEPPPAPL